VSRPVGTIRRIATEGVRRVIDALTGPRRIAAALVVLATVVAGCSSDDADSASASAAGPTTTVTTTTAVPRPRGPAADLSEEIPDGDKAFIAEGDPATGKPAGYEQHEYVAAGTATSYRAVGEQGGDGRWQFEPADSAPYRTRILVRRPVAPADADGTVVVEWLNVSSGADANPDWVSLREELVRRGTTWVGVSAQQIGVLGGPVLVSVPGAQGVAGVGLRTLDPGRYASLQHPGDGYSFDIYTQIARALRAGGPALGGRVPERILAVGESQSAYALTTYIDGVQPLTQAFDGFLVHSRGSTALPLVGPGMSADLASSLGAGGPTKFRTDLDVPIIDVQSESDILSPLNSYDVRQPDSEHFRLWEVAGTAHADARLIGPLVSAGIDCGAPVNAGPMHFVVKAAFRALDRWVRDGTPPPKAPRLEVDTSGTTPAIARDEDKIARGGIRTPLVDAPVATVSGAPGPSADLICLLLGSTTPLPADRLAQLYPSREAYLAAYRKSADAAVTAGFVLRADRDALLAAADPDAIPA
jgi:hypothetical protein